MPWTKAQVDMVTTGRLLWLSSRLAPGHIREQARSHFSPCQGVWTSQGGEVWDRAGEPCISELQGGLEAPPASRGSALWLWA